MRIGVCWYPEQWPRDVWADDVRQMADLGLELVRIGEFAWAAMEPGRDDWRLGWLDEAIELIADAGMRVVLGTPTATPPVWLMRERPEVSIVGPDGRPRRYGSRRHTCPTSAAYREEAARVVGVLARRYGGHADIEAWQVDNEPGNHDSARCWCEACQDAFRSWLRQEFDDDLDALNKAWGQAFWSMTYPEWEAIELPAPTMTAHNPSLDVAHLRFASRQVVQGLAEQRELIRGVDPSTTTFTNLYMGDLDIDARAVHRLHGLGAIDTYPHGLQDEGQMRFNLALARGASLPPGAGVEALGGRAWVVEQQPGPVNWTGDNPAVAAGQVTGWILDAADIGIETLLMFRWRMARAGQEQHHAALLAHDRSSTQAMGEVRQAIASLAGRPARSRATAAVVVDYDDAWILKVVPQTDGADHRTLATTAYAALVKAGHVVDVVGADADLTGYEVVAAPAIHIADDQRIRALRQAVDSGVEVILGVRSLVRNRWAVWSDQPVPAGLAEVLGARVAVGGNPRGWPRDATQEITVEIMGARVAAGPWVDVLELLDGSQDTTEVLGRVVDGPLAGRIVAASGGGVTYLGAASEGAWTAVLDRGRG